MRTLLIEDNEDDVCLIREMLSDSQSHGIELEWADRLSTGLAQMKARRFALVLLDLSLPDSRGLETFTTLQAQAPDLPIIVLTGLDDEALAEQAVREGAQDYLAKGRLDSYILSRAARYAVERKEAQKVLRESEAQLRQAQKMESIGRLTGGIAHDFNNLLTVINGYSEMLLGDIGPSNSFIRSGLEEIKDAGHRAATLTRQLLAFSRRQVLEPKVLDLNEAVANTARLLRRLIGEDIALVFCPDPMLGKIKADPGHLEQIIMNLVINARDAMPAGGQLTVDTRNVAIECAAAPAHPSVLPGSYVLLTVSDTGCGMSEDTLAHIFEPFFTTKEAGKGTGLGLSTVEAIVKQLGGSIRVSSQANQGTSFEVYLPRVEGEADRLVMESSLNDALRGDETILLVEDDQMVRALAEAILERYGYTVVATRNVQDALLFAQEKAFDLVLTDTIMPMMNGPQLARQLRTLQPTIKTLLMSGYTNTDFALTGVQKMEDAFLQKPFTPETLVRKVREVLLTPSTDKRPRIG